MRRALILIVLTSTACSGGPDPTPAPSAPGLMPDWVKQGSLLTHGLPGRLFVGVGSASGIKNQALAKTTADNRAAAEIAKLFEVYSAGLMRDYMATRPPAAPHGIDEFVEQPLRTFSAASMSGAKIVDHYAATDGTWYAQARLHLDQFMAVMAGDESWGFDVREHVAHHAVSTFDATAGQPPAAAPCHQLLESMSSDGERGEIWFVCAGGAAEALIGKHYFFGVLNAGEVRLEDAWGDSDSGCIVDVDATLSGRLASGELTLSEQRVPRPVHQKVECSEERTSELGYRLAAPVGISPAGD